MVAGLHTAPQHEYGLVASELDLTEEEELSAPGQRAPQLRLTGAGAIGASGPHKASPRYRLTSFDLSEMHASIALHLGAAAGGQSLP